MAEDKEMIFEFLTLNEENAKKVGPQAIAAMLRRSPEEEAAGPIVVDLIPGGWRFTQKTKVKG